MSDTKPQPHATEITRPYWDAALAGKLILQRCTRCGTLRHYPQLLCTNCYSDGVEWTEASGRGTVQSWTVAHHAFHPAFKGDLPYTLLIVDLQEGPRAMGRFDGDPAALSLGLPVRIRFDADGKPHFDAGE